MVPFYYPCKHTSGSIVSSQTVDPKKGKLMIVGGGASNQLIEKFVEIAGGSKAKIVIIPTAGSSEEFPEDWYFRKIVEEFGAKKVSVIHTRNPKKANTDEFCKSLKNATGVWFTGGRQWKLVDAYMNTKKLPDYTQKSGFQQVPLQNQSISPGSIIYILPTTLLKEFSFQALLLQELPWMLGTWFLPLLYGQDQPMF